MTPPKLSHLVVNTSNYEPMKQWYLDVLEAEIGVETSNHSACFLRTDENNHRLGMFNVAKTDESVSMAPPGFDGPAVARVNHFAFEHPTLANLFEAYERLAESSITPAGCFNYGPTMSIYYADPDKNIVELFYDKGLTEEQLLEFYAGGDRYILGASPFDPDELLKGLRDGKAVAELVAWAPPGA
ncbi:MAG TPA: VOC family protein [Pseudonocardia sp.]|uniref:VOC family protein n=1 Tax=Pseudonocardia sp. TaxID=60912 RepID=UPI002CEB00E0|nr:VOC family protein [Pseudonocardia sp.]HTF51605.1 VOC family protein [Pseudonocardia sp.]